MKRLQEQTKSDAVAVTDLSTWIKTDAATLE